MSSVKIQNDEAIAYLTDNLTDKQAGVDRLHRLMTDLGNSVVAYPKWHSIYAMEFKTDKKNRYYVKQYTEDVLSEVYDGTAALFAGGYIVFPQTEEKADEIKELVDKLEGLYEGLYAEVLDVPLLTDTTFPVAIYCETIDNFNPNAKSEEETSEGSYGSVHWRDVLIGFNKILLKKIQRLESLELLENLEYQGLNCQEFVGTPSNSFVDHSTKQKMLTMVKAMRDTGML